MAVSPVSAEVGYVQGGSASQWDMFDDVERIPELRWPQSVRTYARMLSEDARISSVYEATTLPLISTRWYIDPNGAPDPVVDLVASDLGLPVDGRVPPAFQPRRRGRFSWSRHLSSALLHLIYGHAVYEQVYRRGETDGLFHLHKLAPRPQRTIADFGVALDGGLEYVKQDPPARVPGTLYGLEGVKIPVDRLVAYVRDREPGVWYGSSMLRPAHKHVMLKDELMRIQAATARRNGMGVPVFTAATPDDPKEVAAMANIARGFRGGMNSGVGLAAGQKGELLGVQGNLPNIRDAIEYHDKAIALVALAHFLNLDKGGSYNLASVLNDTFVQQENAIGSFITDVTNEHVIEDLVDINFGPDVPAPRIAFDEIGSRQDATAAALAQLAAAGLLDADDLARVSIREKFGLPAADPDVEVDEPATGQTPTDATAVTDPAAVTTEVPA